LRYNIAPSQQVPVIVRNEERNILKPMRWGLVPSWTDDKAIWQRLINARAETLRERPSYKRLVSTQRYLIPARWLL
jgi:putative SOS response-associated peptidase YedK